jgi:hypothetical protein
MALKPSVRYPAQTDTDAAYPQGKARNAGSFQDGTGTPLEKDWLNDDWGHKQALLDAAGITPTGDPDEVGASQYLDAQRALFFNVDGGTYALANDLTLDGPGTVTLDGPDTVIADVASIVVPSGGHIDVMSGPGISVKSTGRIELLSGADLDCNSGSSISVETGANMNVQGEINLLTGGQIDVQSGGDINVAADGSINVVSGGLIQLTIGAELSLKSASQLQLTAAAAVAFRLTMLAIPSDPDGWQPNGFGSWLQHDVVAAHHIMFPLNMLPGERLETLLVRIQGGAGAGHVSVPTSRCSAKLISMDVDGVSTDHGSAFSSGASAGAYDALHNMSFSSSMPFTVPTDPLYVQVIGEQGTGTGAVADTLEIVSISGTSTPFLFRGASEIH